MLGIRYTVVLTATIAPKVCGGQTITRSNPGVRLQDYKDSLAWWLSQRRDWMAGIVFAENSGSDLTCLREFVNANNPHSVPVEFISFDHPAPPEGLHYGYSEFILVREALLASKLALKTTHLIKATGRYRFPNIERLVRRLPHDYSIACECRCNRLLSKHRHLFTTFALLPCRRSFFLERLAHLPETMVPAPPWTRSQFIEDVLFDYLAPLKTDPSIIYRWPCNCEPEGVGANGDNYATPRKRIQNAIRAVARVILPRLWL